MKIDKLLTINKTLSTLNTEQVALRSAYNIAKFLSETQSDIKFFKERLTDFIISYGEKDSEGKLIQSQNNEGFLIDKTKLSECEKEMKDINNYEINVPELVIYYEDLPSNGITPQMLIELMPYIKKEADN